jgi:hypothetical protein
LTEDSPGVQYMTVCRWSNAHCHTFESEEHHSRDDGIAPRYTPHTTIFSLYGQCVLPRAREAWTGTLIRALPQAQRLFKELQQALTEPAE